jgi:hypothetical protein
VFIRIVQHCPSDLDGVDLERFEVGLTYDVPTSVATYLIVTQCAEPLAEAEPSIAAQADQRMFSGDWRDWAVAADTKRSTSE